MNFKFERISLEQGLSQSVVYSILQDSQGFMWFGTEEGLNRFDGNNFRIYINNRTDIKSIVNSHIFTMHEDNTENLWVGTFEGNLSRYNRDSDDFTNFIFNLSDENKKNSATITSIIDMGNELFLGTYGTGLIKFNKSNHKYSFISDRQNLHSIDFISSMSAQNEKLIIGTWGNGLIIYDYIKEEFTNHRIDSPSSDIDARNIIKTIFKKKDGNLLIGTNSGIYDYIFDEGEFILPGKNQDPRDILRGKSVTSICEDKDCNLWFGTRYNGIYILDKKTNTWNNLNYNETNKQSLCSDAVISVINDKSNVTWIGSIGGGICKHDGEEKKFIHIPELKDAKKNIVSKNIVTFAEDNNNDIWIGSYGMGLFKFEVSSGKMDNFTYNPEDVNSLGGISVMCLLNDDLNLWVGVQRGVLNKLMSDGRTFERFNYSDSPDEHIFAMVTDKSNAGKCLLIGSNNKGILRFDKEQNKFFEYNFFGEYDLSNVFVKCLYFDSFGELWIGSYNGEGLFRINFKKNEAVNYKFSKDIPGCISDNNIFVIHEDALKNIWIGTYSQGLNKFNRKSDSFSQYTSEDGLANNSIRGILEDNAGSLWISSNKGLSKLNPFKKQFKNYDVSDGLQSNEFNDKAYYKAKDGTFYFGGINGFNYFKPEEIKDNPYIPDIVITDFQIFNHSIKNSSDNPFLKKSITETKEIILSYKESVFSFEFAALIYNNSQKNQYAYMMEGFDKEWIYCGTRRNATYTNLDPGEYKFKVKGSNNDGLWNDEGTSIKIKIAPPFWKTWWFKSLGVMSIAGATGLAYRQKLSKIDIDKKSQEEFSRRLLDSQEQERKRISKELHDTIAHDILITKNKAVIGLKKSHDSDAVKNILNEISDLSSITLNDVRTISYDLHPHQIDRLGMTKAIKSILNNASKS
ncbi:MAG: two-component regulator propeller domain-containing protein, partial [bacterium]